MPARANFSATQFKSRAAERNAEDRISEDMTSAVVEPSSSRRTRHVSSVSVRVAADGNSVGGVRRDARHDWQTGDASTSRGASCALLRAMDSCTS